MLFSEIPLFCKPAYALKHFNLGIFNLVSVYVKGAVSPNLSTEIQTVRTTTKLGEI